MIQLPTLRHLLKQAFAESEVAVRREVGLRLRSAQETEITAAFVLDVGRQLEAASNGGQVARAVHDDLERSLHSWGTKRLISLSEVTDGLIARVSRHTLPEEARTGGDFGMLFVEPVFRFRWTNHLEIERGGSRRGLLVQAKRRLHGRAWNQLTKRQQKVLPSRMAHAALLRYEFEDENNSQLREFRWNVLAGAKIAEVVSWLRLGTFPESQDTGEVVGGILGGTLGTGDRSIIEADICSEAVSSVTVHIDWRDGEDPGPALAQLNRELSNPTSVQQEIKLKQ